MYIGNGSETATAAVLYKSKIKKGGKNQIYREPAKNGEEHGKNKKKPYCRAVLRGSKDLQVLASLGGRRRFFSGHNRLMQRPELVRTRRPAAATATELERKSSGARRKTGGWRLIGPDYL